MSKELKLNEKLISESEEKKYYTKELKKVVYEDMEDNIMAFNMLVEDVNNLLDVEWVNFHCINKNSRNYYNIVKDKISNTILMELWKEKAEKLYNEVMEDLEDEGDLKVFKKYKEEFIEHFEKVELETDEFDVDKINVQYNMQDIGEFIKNIEKNYILSQCNDYYTNLEEIIDQKLSYMDDVFIDNLNILEIQVKWYSQSDWDYYIIAYENKDIKKIEKAHGINIKEWEKQLEKAIWSLFTISEIWFSEVYDVKYYNKNKEFTCEEEEKEFISSIIVYDIFQNIEEEIRQAEWYSKDIEIESNF